MNRQSVKNRLINGFDTYWVTHCCFMLDLYDNGIMDIQYIKKRKRESY